MKLSEAILLGSISTKQGFGPMSIYTESQEKCAFGAALVAINEEYSYSKGSCGRVYTRILELWPWLVRKIDESNSPVSPLNGDTILNTIWRVNDTYRWSRPRIAQWVAEQEAIYDTVPEEVIPILTSEPAFSVKPE